MYMPDLRKALHGDSRRSEGLQGVPAEAGRSKKKSANAQYSEANYKTLKLNVSAGERDAIKAYAESPGMSVNKLLLTALEEFKANHTKKENDDYDESVFRRIRVQLWVVDEKGNPAIREKA